MCDEVGHFLDLVPTVRLAIFRTGLRIERQIGCPNQSAVEVGGEGIRVGPLGVEYMVAQASYGHDEPTCPGIIHHCAGRVVRSHVLVSGARIAELGNRNTQPVMRACTDNDVVDGVARGGDSRTIKVDVGNRVDKGRISRD